MKKLLATFEEQWYNVSKEDKEVHSDWFYSFKEEEYNPLE